MCWSWGNGCGHCGGCGGCGIMDGAGIAVEITEEIPIGEVSTMVMQSAIGMAMMPEETASLAAAAAIMAAVAAETREGDSICTRCELRERKPGGESCPAFFPSVIKNSKNTLKIGATGFEPATSRPPAERATKLRHTPKINHSCTLPNVQLTYTAIC